MSMSFPLAIKSKADRKSEATSELLTRILLPATFSSASSGTIVVLFYIGGNNQNPATVLARDRCGSHYLGPWYCCGQV